MRELAIAFSNSPINNLAPSLRTPCGTAAADPRSCAMKSVRGGWGRGGGEGETSAVFSQRLCAFTPSSLLVCSSRPQRGDAPHASQVTSSPRAPQIAVLNTRRRIGGTAVVSFSFLFLFSLPPSFGPRVEEIAWIFGSNHRPSTPSVESSQLSTVAAFPSPENCAKKKPTKYRNTKIGDGKS